MKEERRRKNEEGRQRMDVTDVAGVTDLTDRRKKEVSKNIFPQTKSAPISRSAFC
jgi:hypothetical protein